VDRFGLQQSEFEFNSGSGNTPVSDDAPWGAAFPDVESIVEGWRHGWESGYYECYFKCMAGPLFSNVIGHITLELTKESMARYFSRMYYSLTDGRFVSGRYSKKLVPRATKTLSKWIGRGLAAYFAFEAWHCIFKCERCL
jgi:hypothetical protein